MLCHLERASTENKNPLMLVWMKLVLLVFIDSFSFVAVLWDCWLCMLALKSTVCIVTRNGHIIHFAMMSCLVIITVIMCTLWGRNFEGHHQKLSPFQWHQIEIMQGLNKSVSKLQVKKKHHTWTGTGDMGDPHCDVSRAFPGEVRGKWKKKGAWV